MTATLVTVTYGKRLELLRQCLDSGFREGCERAVVVNNGSSELIAACTERSFGDRVKVISLPNNSGSANGFAVGIEAALEDGAEYILLLDDDNVLHAGALAILRKAHEEAALETPIDNLIVVGMREEHHQLNTAKEARGGQVALRRNAFLCFHFADAPAKLWRRVRRRNGASMRPDHIPERVERMVAPYGGMYFHRSLIARHGVPDRRLVLYGDDYEFSYRVTRAGGKIWLITAAMLADLESSWNLRSRYGSGLEALLCGDSDVRAYYNCRNFTYFEKRDMTTSPMVRRLNRTICLAVIWLLAIRHRAGERRRLLLRSIADAEQGHLGVNPNFPLP